MAKPEGIFKEPEHKYVDKHKYCDVWHVLPECVNRI